MQTTSPALIRFDEALSKLFIDEKSERYIRGILIGAAKNCNLESIQELAECLRDLEVSYLNSLPQNQVK